MISFVVPVYRSSDSLHILYEEIVTEFGNGGSIYEIIFVEDCGGDASWKKITELCNIDPMVRGFKLGRNCGQHAALLCGIREAKGSIIVTLDDDLQHPPKEVHKLIKQIELGYDVVYGVPKNETHGFLRDLASVSSKFFLEKFTGVQNIRNVSAFRAFDTKLRDAFCEYKAPTVNIDVLLSWATQNLCLVTVNHQERTIGNSGYNFAKLLLHALNLLTGFSIRPLQLSIFVGFFFALFGFGVLLFIVLQWFLQGSIVPGFSFLASIITIFSGVQLISLGIIGEYIGRIYSRSMDKPSYFVIEQTQFLDTQSDKSWDE